MASITQDTLLKRTHEIQCGVCGTPEWAENIGVWNADGTLQETGLCGECEEPKCAAEGCECKAAFNEYYPNSEGGQYWTLCEKCYEADQEEE